MVAHSNDPGAPCACAVVMAGGGANVKRLPTNNDAKYVLAEATLLKILIVPLMDRANDGHLSHA